MQATPSPLPSRPLRSGVYRPARPPPPRVEAPPRAPTLVVLPGFCNDAADYTAPGSEPAVVDALQSRGFSTAVVPIARSDWLKVASCALDPDYWRGRACVSRAYGFYLDAAGDALAAAAASSPSGTAVLVGHSAGGWLGRALIGRDPRLRSLTAGLVSLGTPHAPPGAGGRCPTGGALESVCHEWPGAYFSPEGLAYVAVAGLAVRGDGAAPRGAAARAAASAYATVSGGPGHGVIGDGVVPATVAGLSGAVNLALPGVFHAQARPGGRGRGGRAAARRASKSSGSGGGGGWWSHTDSSSDGEEPAAGPPPPPLPPSRLPWYGSEGVVDAWLGVLVRQLNA